MTQATADLPETASSEQASEDVLADMLTGFADDEPAAPLTETPAEEATTSASPDDQTTPAPESSDVSPQQEEADRLAAVLQRIDAFETTHKQRFDDVYGRVGSMEQILKAQARTPVGQKVQVKLEDFGEFGSEYPDFAQAQLKVINKALSELEVTGLSQEFTADLLKNARTEAETAAEARYSRLRTTTCREELDETHPGWLATIGLPEQDGGTPPDTEFRRWLGTQPKEYADRVLQSYSPRVIGGALDKFADSKKTSTKPAVASTGSSRQQRLTAAVPARTSSAVPAPKRELSGRDAMLEAFKED